MTRQYSAYEVRTKLKDIFKDAYKYPLLDDEYTSILSKVTVVCPIHGDIKKTVSSLIYKRSGCPKCGKLLQVLSLKLGYSRAHDEMLKFYEFASNPPEHLKNSIGDIRLNYGIKPYYPKIVSLYWIFQRHIGPSDYLKNPNT